MKALVVGGGSIGARHLANLRILGVKGLGIVEPDTQRQKGLCLKEEAIGFDGLKDGLEWGPDFVVIATPSNLHVEQALQAAKKDCHVFIEKPLSYSEVHLPELLEEVVKRGLVSLVGCNMRFHPGPATVKKLLEEKAIGQVIAARMQTGSYLPRWRPWQDYRQSYSASTEWGGVVLDCIHEIDLALWYFGEAKVLASAQLPARNIGLGTDGLAEIILRHESGMLSSIHLNFLQRDYRRTCQIIGEEGTIYWDFADHQVRVHGENGDIKEIFREPEGWQLNQMYLDELEHFLWAVRSGSQTVNPISTGIAALEVALTAKKTGTERPA